MPQAKGFSSPSSAQKRAEKPRFFGETTGRITENARPARNEKRRSASYDDIFRNGPEVGEIQESTTIFAAMQEQRRRQSEESRASEKIFFRGQNRFLAVQGHASFLL